jgi:Cu/Zn superoxide dismutase
MRGHANRLPAVPVSAWRIACRPGAGPLAAAVLVVALAGCAGTGPSSPAAADQVGNQEARLRGVGSSATGLVVAVDNEKGVMLTLDIVNLRQGTYRLAFHANPTCNSPTGEAAGPVWGPPDSATSPAELIPIAYAGQAGSISYAVRIPGVHIDRQPSLRGRSIVLHEGPFVDSPLPGMKNNYIACGVFQDLEPGFLERITR